MKLDFLSNPIQEPEYPYFSVPAFFVKIIAPTKQFFSEDHYCYNYMHQVHKQYKHLLYARLLFGYFKQLLLSFNLILVPK